MLRAALVRQAAAAQQHLHPALASTAAGLHSSALVTQQAAEVAPARMEEVAEAVKEVMGQPDPPAVQAQQALDEPLPLSALRFDDPQAAFKAKSTADILRSLVVFKACKIKALVENADSLLAWSRRVFGRTLTNFVIRHTFYKQFVAGEDALRIQPTLRTMKASGVRAILDYAAEDDLDQAPASRQAPQDTVIARTYEYESEKVCDARMSVFLKSIEASHSAEGQGFAAIKMTALGPPALLERTSTALGAIRDLFRTFDEDGNGYLTKEEFGHVYSQLFVDDAPERINELFAHLDANKHDRVDYVDWVSRISVMDTAAIAARCRSRGPFAEAALNADEQRQLRNMVGRVDRLARAAAEADVRLLVDAEHSYFQPAIDNTVSVLQCEHNRTAPRIYNTIQCYMKDAHDRLLTDLERARREKYKYGVKLVRGAYMVLERQRAQELGYPSPVYDTATETHDNYDACVRELLRCVASEGAEVMVATHNQRSVELAVGRMAALGLPPASGVYFGQLLGMADHLTYTLGAHGYGAYKYVPFGAVDEVMPYLIRRAQENSSLLASAAIDDEVAMLRKECVRRMGLTLQPPLPGS